jgi:hypothetical protein
MVFAIATTTSNFDAEEHVEEKDQLWLEMIREKWDEKDAPDSYLLYARRAAKVEYDKGESNTFAQFYEQYLIILGLKGLF